MVDKNVFTQELKKVFTILKEIKLVEKYVKELIDNNNLTEDKVSEFEETLNKYKRDLDYLNETSEQLQESLNQININLEDLIEYIDSIKDFINQNENTTEVGGNLEVDGTLRVNSNIVTEDMSISGELSLPSTSNLVFEDGSTIGGGNLYAHYLYIKNLVNVVIYSTNPNPMTTQELADYLKNAKLKSYLKYYPATGKVSTGEMIIGFFIDTSNIFNYVAIGKSTKTISINGEDVTVVSSIYQTGSTMGGISYVTLTDNVVQL